MRVPDLPRGAKALLVVVIWAALCVDPAWSAEVGQASWYGAESGRYTANGERFRPDAMTCARRRQRFGSLLRVTDLATGRSIVCRVNDRGPFIPGRIIDLSRGAARQLGILSAGTAKVKIEVLGK